MIFTYGEKREQIELFTTLENDYKERIEMHHREANT
jgi:hypothetical protein